MLVGGNHHGLTDGLAVMCKDLTTPPGKCSSDIPPVYVRRDAPPSHPLADPGKGRQIPIPVMGGLRLKLPKLTPLPPEQSRSLYSHSYATQKGAPSGMQSHGVLGSGASVGVLCSAEM